MPCAKLQCEAAVRGDGPAPLGPRRGARGGRVVWPLAGLLLWSLAGCGTTKWSDTQRTATEQLLISSAVDKAVSEFDFSMLANREVYFDASYLRAVVDENYVVSSLRQHLLANGCILRDSRDQAEFVVEARSGGIGTDRSDLLFGVPSVSVPSVPGVPLPSAIPEIPFAKSTKQKAVAKLAVFVYNRETGRPVLQTGVSPGSSTAQNSWFFGAGPFQRGTVYEGTKFAGGHLSIPIIGGRREDHHRLTTLAVTTEAAFPENMTEARQLANAGTGAPGGTSGGSGPAARVAASTSTAWALNQGSKLPPAVPPPAAPRPAPAAAPTPPPAPGAAPAPPTAGLGPTTGDANPVTPLPGLLQVWQTGDALWKQQPAAKPAAKH